MTSAADCDCIMSVSPIKAVQAGLAPVETVNQQLLAIAAASGSEPVAGTTLTTALGERPTRDEHTNRYVQAILREQTTEDVYVAWSGTHESTLFRGVFRSKDAAVAALGTPPPRDSIILRVPLDADVGAWTEGYLDSVVHQAGKGWLACF